MSPIHFALVVALFAGFGTHSSRMLLILYALNLGAPPYVIGLLAATSSAFPLVLSLSAGKLIDRFGARWPLMISIAGAACAMVVPFAWPGLIAIFIAITIIGFSFSYYNVALQNLAGVLSTAENRAQNFANFSMAVSAATFVGPLIAGFSIDHLGHGIASLAVGLLWLAPVAMLAVWGRMLPPGNPKVASSRTSVMETLKNPGVRKVLIICSLVQSGFDLFLFYLPVYANGIGLSASAIGFVLAMFAAASFVARMVTQWLLNRYSAEQVLRGAFYLAAAGTLLVPWFEGIAMLSVVAFAFGLGISCGQPITMLMMFSHSAEGRSGEALGLRLTVNHLTRVVSPAVFGVIASGFGLLPIFCISALMLAWGGMLTRADKAR